MLFLYCYNAVYKIKLHNKKLIGKKFKLQFYTKHQKVSFSDSKIDTVCKKTNQRTWLSWCTNLSFRMIEGSLPFFALRCLPIIYFNNISAYNAQKFLFIRLATMPFEIYNSALVKLYLHYTISGGFPMNHQKFFGFTSYVDK